MSSCHQILCNNSNSSAQMASQQQQLALLKQPHQSPTSSTNPTSSLLDLCAKIVAKNLPYQLIEERYNQIPPPVQIRIIYYSFPQNEEDIKMYSSLSTSSSDNITSLQQQQQQKLNNTNNNNTSSSTSTANLQAQQNANNNNNNNNNQPPSSSNNHNPINNRQYPWLMAAAYQALGQDQAQNNNNNINNNNINNNNNNNNNTPIASNTSSNGNSSGTKNNNNKQLTFHKGLRLYNDGCVHDVLQVGFNLSGLISIKISQNNQLSSNSRIRAYNPINPAIAPANQNLQPPQQQPPAPQNNNQAAAAAAAMAMAAAMVNQANANVAAVDQLQNHHHNHHHHHHHHQQAGQANISNNNSNDISSPTNTGTNSISTDTSSPTKSFRASVTFDRCKITSVSCSCESQDIFWCEHVVALILYRIRKPETIDLRIPISETLLSLDRQQLQKLVQYIIAEHHTEVLPTAQRLLDEMRQSFSVINRIQGAPDPTAGASANDENTWHLDEYQVNEKVQNYLNLVCSNSKEAVKQIHALFDKIREMFRAKDSNGTRLLRLITEQFLLYATKNEKSRPLWDQLVSLWVIVMLNPDLPKTDKSNFIELLVQWSAASKCPKEDIDRRITTKRKAAELLSDDEDGDNYLVNPYFNEYPMSYNQSNNYPAHMATHMHRYPTVSSNSVLPVLRSFNPQVCPCHHMSTNSINNKKLRTHFMQGCSETFNQFRNSHNAGSSSSTYKPSSSSNSTTSSSTSSSSSSYSNQLAVARSNLNNYSPPNHQNNNNNNDARIAEPRSVFYRAVDFKNITWDDPHLQLILKGYGTVDYDTSQKSILFDYTGNPLWLESVSRAAARVETLKSHGYKDQALRLTVATVRRLKLLQDQWCLAATSESNNESPCMISAKGLLDYSEGWIGHPFDPINVLLDILLEASMTETNNGNINQPNIGSNNPSFEKGLCTLSSTRCSCPYNQVLSDFTHRYFPDLATLSYQHRIEALPMLHSVNLVPRLRQPSTAIPPLPNPPTNHPDKTLYYHVAVPGCCQKDSYLTLGVEVALIALGQQRSIPTIATAHDRAVRQEAELISKLESIDTSDPLLIDILKHQSTLLLEGGPYQNSCCGVPTDSAPLHTYARYLFESLVSHYPQLAYKIGVYALKMPLLTDENSENYARERTSPRTINHNHLQSEQLNLAQAMLSKAKDEGGQQGGFLKKVFRASVKNIRNPASLLKLSKHVLKEAKPSGTTLYPPLLKTSFDLGLQVLRMTISPHTSNGKTRREAILFIVECATDTGLDAVLQVMKESREYFSAIEALNLVVARDNDHVNLRSQALSKLKLKDNHQIEILNSRARDLVLDCASRDPSNCALEALKFCETDDDALKRALDIVTEAGTNNTMDSTQLIKVADHIHERGMTEKAFDIAMVAVNSLTIPSLSDNSSSKKDIFSACEYAQKVGGFALLIPKLIMNIECATVLSEIYHRFSPDTLVTPAAYRNFTNQIFSAGNDYNMVPKEIFRLNPQQHDLYQQKIQEYNQQVEDSRWWKALLETTLKAFDSTARTRLLNISPRHYGEFIDFMVKAQGIYQKAVDGPKQFQELISQLMKLHKGKKKLMERLKSKFDDSIKLTL